MLLKGCLHVHTTCSDGKLTPQQAANVYASLGYDFIAFTDHDYLLKTNSDEVYDSVRTEMIIFKGIEITAHERGYIHINKITGDSEVLHIVNHLAEYEVGVEQINERLTALAVRYPIDAVEITTKGFYNAEFDTDAIPYPRLASDDSHTRIGCGRAWIELDCRRAKDSILRAVKKNRFWNCYQRG